MWNFFSRLRQRRTQRQAAQGFRFTVIAPETRGQNETIALRDNIDDLGAAAALQQVIEASRPRVRDNWTVTSQTASLHVKTNVSAVSSDSEDYIRNEYTDTGRRPPRQQGGPASSPLAVAPAAQSAESKEDDYIEVDKADIEVREKPQSTVRNLVTDPVGTLLHVGAAATLVSGTPGRQYIRSGPPPPDQRGRVPTQSGSKVSLLLTPPLSPALTERSRAASSPAYSCRRRMSDSSMRSARTF